MGTNAINPINTPFRNEKSVLVYHGKLITDPSVSTEMVAGIDSRSQPFVELTVGDRNDLGRLQYPFEKIRVFQDRGTSETRWRFEDRSHTRAGYWGELPNANKVLSITQREYLAHTIEANRDAIETRLTKSQSLRTDDLSRLEGFLNRVFGTKIRLVGRGL